MMSSAQLRHEFLIDAYRGVLAALQRAETFEPIAEVVAGYARIVLDASGATVTRIEGDDYVHTASAGSPTPEIGRRLALAGSFTGEVVRQRQPRFFRLEDAAPGSRDRALAEGIASGIMAPVMVDGRVVATVGISSARTDAFDNEDLDVLTGFAEYLAIGLTLIAHGGPKLAASHERLRSAATDARRELAVLAEGARQGVPADALADRADALAASLTGALEA
ncbi:MAG: GAF domain-containing protein [Deltaproteobacteria bacterium]|nr:GAF domain-containing protein [Deltaproteobacteria bacterium]